MGCSCGQRGGGSGRGRKQAGFSGDPVLWFSGLGGAEKEGAGVRNIPKATLTFDLIYESKSPEAT